MSMMYCVFLSSVNAGLASCRHAAVQYRLLTVVAGHGHLQGASPAERLLSRATAHREGLTAVVAGCRLALEVLAPVLVHVHKAAPAMVQITFGKSA